MIGEEGPKALDVDRKKIEIVAATATVTIQRIDPPDEPGDPHRVVFAVARDGRYDITITDPLDPDGEVRREVSDGVVSADIGIAMRGDMPIIKRRPAGSRDQLQRIFSCLSQDLVTLRKEYNVELRRADGGLREMRLTPSNPGLANDIVSVSAFLDANNRPVRTTLDDPSGNRQRLEIQTYEINPKPNPLWFVVPPAK